MTLTHTGVTSVLDDVRQSTINNNAHSSGNPHWSISNAGDTTVLKYFELYGMLIHHPEVRLIDVRLLGTNHVNLPGRIRIHFALHGGARQFVLLRGLLQFGSVEGVLISSDKTGRTFTIECTMTHDKEATAFLKEVFRQYSRELTFKRSLRALRHREQTLTRAIEDLYVEHFRDV